MGSTASSSYPDDAAIRLFFSQALNHPAGMNVDALGLTPPERTGIADSQRAVRNLREKLVILLIRLHSFKVKTSDMYFLPQPFSLPAQCLPDFDFFFLFFFRLTSLSSVL